MVKDFRSLPAQDQRFPFTFSAASFVDNAAKSAADSPRLRDRLIFP
jgi:hypothetical protein